MEEMLERQRTEMENYRREIDGLRGRRDEAEGTRVKLPKPTLQKLNRFLAMFERIAEVAEGSLGNSTCGVAHWKGYGCLYRCIQSVDWTTGLDYWTGLLESGRPIS